MRLTFSLIFILAIHFEIFAQVSDYGSSTEIHDIVSQDNKKYQLKVTLPNNYQTSKSYKVLYYLDSWWLSETVLGSYALLQLSEKVEDIVLIGITTDGNLKDWNIQRTLDFTPSNYDIEVMGINMRAGSGENSIELNPNNTGGADSFIEFIETKVFPYVEETYPNLGMNRGLLGHSYGGLFSFYVMQKQPQLFSDFLIISPSLWWNKSELSEKSSFSKFLSNKKPVNLHFSYGGVESKLITKSSLEMNEIILDLENENLNYEFNFYEKANHNSILPQAIYDGLLFLYGN